MPKKGGLGQFADLMGGGGGGGGKRGGGGLGGGGGGGGGRKRGGGVLREGSMHTMTGLFLYSLRLKQIRNQLESSGMK